MGYTLSGWAGILSGDERLKTFTIPGTVTKQLPKGRRVTVREDVGPYLVAVAAEWHKRVDPLNSNTAGHVYRQARLSTTLSDHAAGTAIDVSWDKFPMGKKGTLTKKQLAEIEKIKKEFPGIGWGGDWGGGPYVGDKSYDPMHWYLPKNDIAYYREQMKKLGIDDEGYRHEPRTATRFNKDTRTDLERDNANAKAAELKNLQTRKRNLQSRKAALRLKPGSKLEIDRLNKLIADINMKIRSLNN